MKKINLVLFFLLFVFSTFAQQKKILDQVLAIVGNDIVLESAVESQYLQYQAQGVETDGDVRCMIFEDLLYQKLLLNQAKLDSVEVSDKEVDGELNHRINMFIEQIGSKEKLEAYFNKTLAEIKSEFRDIIRDQLITRRMQAKIAGDIKITPSEVQKFFNKIPKDSLPMIQAETEYSQIVRYPKISEEAKSEVRKRLEDYRDRVLNKGADFGTLAFMYSEDPGSKDQNGELGFVNRADLVPQFSSAAFALKEGEVSKVVETEFGFHIIQLIARKGDQVNVRHILLKPKTMMSEMLTAKKFLDSIKVVLTKDTLTFEQAAMRFSDDENTRANGGVVVNPYTGTSKFENDQIDNVTHYAIDKLTVGQRSAPFESTDEKGKKGYKIVLIKSKTQAHVANLRDDYQMIQDLALAKKKEETVDEWIRSKQKTTYVKIKGDYKNCVYKNVGWVK